MFLNPYRRLLDLLPQRPLLVGTVESVSGNVSTVLLPSGGRVTARGAAPVGQRVFLRDGVIESDAPNLEVVEYDV